MQKGVTIRCESLATNGIDYAWRMGLFGFLGVTYTPAREEHEEAGRFIPLRRITTSQELRDFLASVATLLHRPEHAQAVQYSLSETIRNVLEHAGGSPAYACAQYYPKPRRVSIGVADCGIGIRRSLERYYNLQSDGEALLEAMRPGITGAPRGIYGTVDNAGAGLFFTKSIAKSSHEYFAIYSGTAAYRLRRVAKSEDFRLYLDPRHDRHDFFEALPRWAGTVVGLDMGIRRLASFEITMSLIRDAYASGRKKKVAIKVRFR